MRDLPVVTSLAVIIVNYRTPDLALKAVESVVAASGSFDRFRVIVVDGGSADGSVEVLATGIAAASWSDRATLLPLAINGGFAFGNNQAVALLAEAGPLPEAIALINPDARVLPGALEALAAVLDREPRAAAVGALLVHEDGRRQSSAFHFPSLRGEFCRGARTHLFERVLGVPQSSVDSDAALEVPWVTGAAVMFRTAALVDTGLFDEGFFLYFEETELMRRLRDCGWTVWHEPAARVIHEGGASTQIRNPETGLPRARRVPAYWYQSRRRYFALAHGRPVALAAGLAWLAGQCWWRLRQLVAPRGHHHPLRETRDMLAFGLWPSAGDGQKAARTIDAARSVRPAWMASSTERPR